MKVDEIDHWMLVPFIEILQNIFLHVCDYRKFIAGGGESVVTSFPCSRVCGFCCRVQRCNGLENSDLNFL
jgi:hypothetical protein